MDCYIVGTGQEFEDNDWVEKSFVTPEGYVWHLVLRVKGWYEE
jgi:hypothetical protein